MAVRRRAAVDAASWWTSVTASIVDIVGLEEQGLCHGLDLYSRGRVPRRRGQTSVHAGVCRGAVMLGCLPAWTCQAGRIDYGQAGPEITLARAFGISFSMIF